MLPEHEVVHLRHDLASQKARDKHIASEARSVLEIALEALECDRPHVAKEKIEVAISIYLAKIGE